MKAMILAVALAWFPAEASLLQDKKDPDVLKITADFENAPIGEVLDSLKAISGIPIELDGAARKVVDPETRIAFKVHDTSLTNSVKLLLTGRGLEVTVVDKKKVLITVPKGK